MYRVGMFKENWGTRRSRIENIPQKYAYKIIKH